MIFKYVLLLTGYVTLGEMAEHHIKTERMGEKSKKTLNLSITNIMHLIII